MGNCIGNKKYVGGEEKPCQMAMNSGSEFLFKMILYKFLNIISENVFDFNLIPRAFGRMVAIGSIDYIAFEGFYDIQREMNRESPRESQFFRVYLRNLNFRIDLAEPVDKGKILNNFLNKKTNFFFLISKNKTSHKIPDV